MNAHVDNGTTTAARELDALDRITWRDPWPVFEMLPAPIRRALQQHNTDLCPHDVAAFLREASRRLPPGKAINLTLRALAADEQRELVEFSDEHAEQHGRPTAHVAASASVMRYENRKARP